jgi:hypothetical protein
MKSWYIRLSAVAVFMLLPFLIITRRKRSIIYLFLLFISVSLTGCFRNFYQTDTKSSIDAATLSRLVSEKKYFIIHFSNSTNALADAYVKNDSLYGRITTLAPQHTGYLNPNTADTTLRIKPGTKEDVLTEVHLYTAHELNNNDSTFVAGVSAFNRADIYKFNKKATHENHIMSVVGIAVGSFVLLSLIAVAALGGYTY